MVHVATPQVDVTVLFPPRKGPTFRRELYGAALAGLRVALGQDGPSGLGPVGRDVPVQVGLVIADDDTLRRLNREYRGADEVTDVLAFSWDHQGHWEGDEEPASDRGPMAGDPDFPAAMETSRSLGEVVVSYPQAQRQAQAQGHPTERELARLIVHGILHLAGYDHTEPADETRMKARERQALRHLFGEE